MRQNSESEREYGDYRPRAMKKAYSPPTVKTLTPEDAKKLIAMHRNFGDEEAATYHDSLRRKQRDLPEGPNQKCSAAPDRFGG